MREREGGTDEVVGFFVRFVAWLLLLFFPGEVADERGRGKK